MKTIIPKTEIDESKCGFILSNVAANLNNNNNIGTTTTTHHHDGSHHGGGENNSDFVFREHISISEIEQILGNVMKIRIHSPFHYQRAFVHKSILRLQRGLSDEEQKRIPEYMKESNERLELLGDAVLSICVVDYLLKMYPDADEGVLTVYRTRIVKGDTLAMFARELGLDRYLLLSKQTRKTSGSKNNNLLENTFEALIGALYEDQGVDGFEVTRNFVIQCVKKYFQLESLQTDDNYKDVLLRMCQQLEDYTIPRYEKISESGKPNQKEFTVVVHINGKRFGKGFGNKIKRAEQHAAKNAIHRILELLKH